MKDTRSRAGRPNLTCATTPAALVEAGHAL